MSSVALELTSGFISGKGGLAGWQWAFIITGCLGLVFSSVIFMFLPDWPDSPQTRFRSVLTEEEGRFMVARLPPTTSRSSDENFDWAAIRRELRSPLLCELLPPPNCLGF